MTATRRLAATLLLHLVTYYHVYCAEANNGLQQVSLSKTKSLDNDTRIFVEEIVLSGDLSASGIANSVPKEVSIPAKLNEDVVSMLTNGDTADKSLSKRNVDSEVAQTQTIVMDVEDLKDIENLESVLAATNYESKKIDGKKTKRKIFNAPDDLYDYPRRKNRVNEPVTTTERIYYDVPRQIKPSEKKSFEPTVLSKQYRDISRNDRTRPSETPRFDLVKNSTARYASASKPSEAPVLANIFVTEPVPFSHYTTDSKLKQQKNSQLKVPSIIYPTGSSRVLKPNPQKSTGGAVNYKQRYPEKMSYLNRMKKLSSMSEDPAKLNAKLTGYQPVSEETSGTAKDENINYTAFLASPFHYPGLVDKNRNKELYPAISETPPSPVSSSNIRKNKNIKKVETSSPKIRNFDEYGIISSYIPRPTHRVKVHGAVANTTSASESLEEVPSKAATKLRDNTSLSRDNPATVRNYNKQGILNYDARSAEFQNPILAYVNNPRSITFKELQSLRNPVENLKKLSPNFDVSLADISRYISPRAATHRDETVGTPRIQESKIPNLPTTVEPRQNPVTFVPYQQSSHESSPTSTEPSSTTSTFTIIATEKSHSDESKNPNTRRFDEEKEESEESVESSKVVSQSESVETEKSDSEDNPESYREIPKQGRYEIHETPNEEPAKVPAIAHRYRQYSLPRADSNIYTKKSNWRHPSNYVTENYDKRQKNRDNLDGKTSPSEVRDQKQTHSEGHNEHAATSKYGEVDQKPAQTDHHHEHKGEPAGGHKYEKGDEEDHEEEHHGEEGVKDHKGYESWHEDEKASKGYHDKEQHSGYYDEKDGEEKKHEEEGGYHEEEQKGEKGEKDVGFEEKGQHKKGHSTKGEHFIHKKDEYEKKTEFFDEFHDDGESEKEGEYFQEHEGEKGGHESKGHHEKQDHEDKHGKSREYEEGKEFSEHKGHKIDEGHDGHHSHHEKHGKKQGKAEGRSWSHKKEDDGGGGKEHH